MSARGLIYGPRVLAIAHNLLNGAEPATMGRMLIAVGEGVSRLEEAHLLLREASGEVMRLVDGREFGSAMARLQRAAQTPPVAAVDGEGPRAKGEEDEELRRAEAQAVQHKAGASS
jgi:hypothetical protein